MIACIHQPEHMPWMGLIHKIAISDIYIVLDNVQFKKNYFENRNKIYTKQGLQWLTVPVKIQGHIQKKFFEIEPMDNWKRKYLATLSQTYAKAPYLKDIKEIISVIDLYEGNYLADLNLEIIQMICRLIGIGTKIIRAKDVIADGKKTELLINLLNQVEANEYIVGKSGFDYMDLDRFDANGIRLIVHKFNHPRYKPFNYDKMTDFPSIIDVIANLGIPSVKKCIYENNKT